MRGYRRVQPTPITPSTLSGRIGDWRADTGLTLSGSAVTGWADQSASAKNLAQATGSKQPAYAATGLNGKPTVTFTRANSQSLAAASALWTGDQAFTSFVVATLSDTSRSAYFSIGATGAHNYLTLALNYNASTQAGLNTNGSFAYHTAGVRVAASASDVMLVSHTKEASTDLSTALCYKKGVKKVLNSSLAGTATVTAGSTNIGENIGSTGTGYAFGGSISHVLIYSRVLTDIERQGIEAYLMQTWMG